MSDEGTKTTIVTMPLAFGEDVPVPQLVEEAVEVPIAAGTSATMRDLWTKEQTPFFLSFSFVALMEWGQR